MVQKFKGINCIQLQAPCRYIVWAKGIFILGDISHITNHLLKKNKNKNKTYHKPII